MIFNLIGDTDAVMESPLSLDEETLDDNLEQDTSFENENNGEMLLNDRHLSNNSDISKSKQKKNGKYLDISKFCEGHVFFLLICTFIRNANHHL